MATHLLVFGTDAGGLVWTPKGWVHVDGWEPRQMETVQSAMRLAELAASMKDPAMQKQTLELSHTMLKPQAEYLAKL